MGQDLPDSHVVGAEMKVAGRPRHENRFAVDLSNTSPNRSGASAEVQEIMKWLPTCHSGRVGRFKPIVRDGGRSGPGLPIQALE